MKPTDQPAADPSSSLPPDEHDRRAARLSTLVALIVPLVLIGLAVVAQLALLGTAPARVAIHWDVSGRPDGWAPAWSVPILTAAIGVFVIAVLGLPVVRAMRSGDRRPGYRLLGAVALGVSALVAILSTGTFWQQTDGEQGGVLPSLIAALVIAALAGTAGWWVQPDLPATQTHRPVSALPIADGEQAVWLQSAVAGPAVAMILGATVLLTVLAGLFSWAGGASWSVILTLAVVTAVSLLVAATTLAYQVRVSADGLTITSFTGLPRFHIPIDQISAVRVDDDVSPLGDYGGYGIRMRPGTTAVVVRRGAAIVVDRISGRSLAVVVDDAATGAALLTAYLGDAVSRRSAESR
ncbi:hypothetical protein GOHSU_04_00030 [Gordonia hirsuta DSM 44140 = NBRC 16056]|uniref:DUF1648 domain-containing protein n=1 Tax=Gordonia hirsuta DSM 44140 = NBRC 16056 TaxID=1121927 RepID=L7L5C3_9ACTN|nr:DUF1648 domain-containing protein [Gordonia hirsuta]GAC56134.1 hypothetical protein GOHSU_04_00030 [Gordonia hirsuta DSM 44140 = NBRC 16056]